MASASLMMSVHSWTTLLYRSGSAPSGRLALAERPLGLAVFFAVRRHHWIKLNDYLGHCHGVSLRDYFFARRYRAVA
jgi:hypothetical protein